MTTDACTRCQNTTPACICAVLFAEHDRLEAAGLLPWQTRRQPKGAP